jgi:hypothetical protein
MRRKTRTSREGYLVLPEVQDAERLMMNESELLVLISRFGAQCADVMFWQSEILHRRDDSNFVVAAKDCKQKSVIKREKNVRANRNRTPQNSGGVRKHEGYRGHEMNSEADNKYYQARCRRKERQYRAYAKAANRVRVAEEWLKTNQISIETKPDFDKVMKQADHEWERNNPK